MSLELGLKRGVHGSYSTSSVICEYVLWYKTNE